MGRVIHIRTSGKVKNNETKNLLTSYFFLNGSQLTRPQYTRLLGPLLSKVNGLCPKAALHVSTSRGQPHSFLSHCYEWEQFVSVLVQFHRPGLHHCTLFSAVWSLALRSHVSFKKCKWRGKSDFLVTKGLEIQEEGRVCYCFPCGSLGPTAAVLICGQSGAWKGRTGREGEAMKGGHGRSPEELLAVQWTPEYSLEERESEE